MNTELVKEKVKKEEVKECTFTPQLTARAKASRSFGRFLADQNNFLQRKKKSLADLTEIASPGIPKIDSNSILLATKKNRGASIHNHLYNSSKKTIAPTEEVKDQLKESTRITREKGDAIILQGFNKEFQRALDEFGLSSSDTVSFKEMLLILEKMRLLNDTESNVGETNGLVHRLWRELKPPKDTEASVKQLKSYIAGILNLSLSPDCCKAGRDFAPLYWNRQCNKQRKEAVCEFSFKPILCKESLVMAELLRKKGDRKVKRTVSSGNANGKVSSQCTFKPKINAYKRVDKSKIKREEPLNDLKEVDEDCKGAKDVHTVEELERLRTKRAKSSQSLLKVKKANKSEQGLSYKVKDIIGHKSTDMDEKSITPKKFGMNKNKSLSMDNQYKYAEQKEAKSPSKNTNLDIPKGNELEELEADREQFEDKSNTLLYIDVNLRGCKQRIVVYRDDTAHEVAEKFALENSIVAA